MTIAKRMYLLVAACAIAMIILIGIALSQVIRVYEYTNLANVNGIPSIMELAKAENYYQKLRLNLLRHVTATAQEEKDDYAGQIQNRRKVIEEALDNYKSLQMDEQDKTLLAAEQKMFASYFDQMNHVLALSNTNAPEAVGLLQEADKLAVMLTAKLDEHIVYNQRLSLQDAANAADIKQAVVWEFLGIAVLCLGIIIALGVWITKRLRAQLGVEPAELTVIARNFVEGNLTQKIVLPETDKSSVAYSIRVLQRTLDGLVQSLGYVSQQHD
ncbi:methyl-accepting chemotaxis protein, partial [Methylophilus rhizosphaerae]